MTTNSVYVSNIYWNKGLGSFFFREQSMKTLEELINRSTMSGDAVLSVLDEKTEEYDIDDVEEQFYEMSVEDIAEVFGIELENEKEEEL